MPAAAELGLGLGLQRESFTGASKCQAQNRGSPPLHLPWWPLICRKSPATGNSVGGHPQCHLWVSHSTPEPSTPRFARAPKVSGAPASWVKTSLNYSTAQRRGGGHRPVAGSAPPLQLGARWSDECGGEWLCPGNYRHPGPITSPLGCPNEPACGSHPIRHPLCAITRRSVARSLLPSSTLGVLISRPIVAG